MCLNGVLISYMRRLGKMLNKWGLTWDAVVYVWCHALRNSMVSVMEILSKIPDSQCIFFVFFVFFGISHRAWIYPVI